MQHYFDFSVANFEEINTLFFLICNQKFQNLRDSLDTEKNRKLQDLEDRLMRRRMARKKELAGADPGSTDYQQLEQALQVGSNSLICYVICFSEK